MSVRKLLGLSCLGLAACASGGEPAEPVAVSERPAATSVEVFLPEGDPARGRAAFLELRCNVCHAVPGEDMEPPTAPTPGPELGVALTVFSRDELATSIITPSHVVDERIVELTESLVSPMGDYTNVMTIRQLIDIVAFLQLR